MGSHYNNLFKKIITAFESKCLHRNHVKDMKRKLIIGNVFITTLYLLLAAVTSYYLDKFTFVQAMYAWFITLTTVGFGDFIPMASTTVIILSGLCLMSGCMDAMVMHAEQDDGKSVWWKLKETLCCRCCGKKVLSVKVKSFQEENKSNTNETELNGTKNKTQKHFERSTSAQ